MGSLLLMVMQHMKAEGNKFCQILVSGIYGPVLPCLDWYEKIYKKKVYELWFYWMIKPLFTITGDLELMQSARFV